MPTPGTGYPGTSSFQENSTARKRVHRPTASQQISHEAAWALYHDRFQARSFSMLFAAPLRRCLLLTICLLVVPASVHSQEWLESTDHHWWGP